MPRRGRRIEKLLHFGNVVINSGEAVEPISALMWTGSKSDIGKISILCIFREVPPDIAGATIMFDSLFERRVIP